MKQFILNTFFKKELKNVFQEGRLNGFLEAGNIWVNGMLEKAEKEVIAKAKPSPKKLPAKQVTKKPAVKKAPIKKPAAKKVVKK